MADFIATNHGTVFLFLPVSEAARELTRELPLEAWQFMGKSFAIDHGPAAHFIAQLREDGYHVEGV